MLLFSAFCRIQRHSQVFEKLLSQKMPRLSKHLVSLHFMDYCVFEKPYLHPIFKSKLSVKIRWTILYFKMITEPFPTFAYHFTCNCVFVTVLPLVKAYLFLFHCKIQK